LAKSRVHLEKLRNIFMNNPGFMLVMTGTPDLFPLMDDVFSPIIRQFKKIFIGPFADPQDTLNCIRKPLASIGISNLPEIMPYESLFDIHEIHELSGGRPYEIQLICRLLFKRVQEGRSKRMELTVDVLDDIRKELEAFQDVSKRPVLAAIQRYDKRQLSALHLLCACSGRAVFEQIWFSEYVFWADKRWTKESLQEQLLIFKNAKVVRIENDVVIFAGDEFDRIYCKYWARRYGVTLSIREMRFDFYLSVRLRSFFSRYREKDAEDLIRIMIGGVQLQYRKVSCK